MTAPRDQAEPFGRAVREIDAQARARRIMAAHNMLIEAVCNDIAGGKRD